LAFVGVHQPKVSKNPELRWRALRKLVSTDTCVRTLVRSTMSAVAVGSAWISCGLPVKKAPWRGWSGWSGRGWICYISQAHQYTISSPAFKELCYQICGSGRVKTIEYLRVLPYPYKKFLYQGTAELQCLVSEIE
jgi:hypothetical protein